MPPKVKQGDSVVTLQTIRNRTAFFKRQGHEGRTTVSIAKGTRLKAAANELGGNIFVDYRTPGGDAVVVPLAEGEWQRAAAAGGAAG